jgi:hypothetical protein
MSFCTVTKPSTVGLGLLNTLQVDGTNGKPSFRPVCSETPTEVSGLLRSLSCGYV